LIEGIHYIYYAFIHRTEHQKLNASCPFISNSCSSKVRKNKKKPPPHKHMYLLRAMLLYIRVINANKKSIKNKRKRMKNKRKSKK
jgi:hypothetical protein